jgi:hypothetical protein
VDYLSRVKARLHSGKTVSADLSRRGDGR